MKEGGRVVPLNIITSSRYGSHHKEGYKICKALKTLISRDTPRHVLGYTCIVRDRHSHSSRRLFRHLTYCTFHIMHCLLLGQIHSGEPVLVIQVAYLLQSRSLQTPVYAVKASVTRSRWAWSSAGRYMMIPTQQKSFGTGSRGRSTERR